MRRVRLTSPVVVLVATVLLLAGCGSDSGSGSSQAATNRDLAAAAQPSDPAKMICADEAREDIEVALGATVTKPLDPTWADQVYSCDYVFPEGTMNLSVKDLADDESTQAYFGQLESSLGAKTSLDLGQGGFQAGNDVVVVRKDHQVLSVDVAGLPSQLGSLPRAAVGTTVATTIMGCWV